MIAYNDHLSQIHLHGHVLLPCLIEIDQFHCRYKIPSAVRTFTWTLSLSRAKVSHCYQLLELLQGIDRDTFCQNL